MFKLNNKIIRSIFFLLFIAIAGSAQAAITVVASSSNNSANNSLSIAQPAGTIVGDVMVAQIARRGGAPEVFTPPPGWLEIGTGLHLGGSGSNTYKHRAYYRVVDGSETPPFVWNFTGNRNNVGGITSYRGVDISNPINMNSQIGLTTNANSIAATGVTTTIDGAMLIAMYGVNSDKTYTTPAGGYTPRYEQLSPANNIEIKSFDVIQASAGPTGSPSTSWTGNVNRRVARLIALTPAAVIGGTTAYIVSFGLVGNQTYTGSLGMDFDVVSDISITDLGAFDSGSDGLSRTITVQVFDRNNTVTLLAQLIFTPGAPGTLEGGSRIKTLGTPLTLSAGFQGSIVASNYGPGEPNCNTGVGACTSLTTDDGGGLISFVGGSRYGTANLYPANVDGGPANRYAAGTFKFTTGPPVLTVPEMEVAEITLNDTNMTPSFTSISFKQNYATPPLVFILPSNEGPTPASIRIKQPVTTTGFQVSQVEPDNQDGPHPAMTVHYMAIEPGSGPGPWTFTLPDGRLVEVGTHPTQTVQHGTGVAGTEGWDTINFSNSFTAPAVLTAIQSSANESATPGQHYLILVLSME